MNLNTQYEFSGKLKRNLIIGMGIGVLCLVLVLLGDDEYKTRFWSTILHNSVYFTGIAFTAAFFLAAQITAFAGWNSVVKRVWEAMGQFMLVGLVLMGVIVAGVWGHLHHLYHWNTPGITDPNNPIYDEILAGKSGFLNPVFFTIGVLGFLALWYFLFNRLRKASVDQDTMETASLDYYKKQRKTAALFLPIAGFLSPIFLWLCMMSLDPHWYSTMFAWYGTISMLLGALSLTIMLIIFLKSQGYMEYVSRDHLHDIGKYLFGISVFWTYLWFDQFMLIWYANVGEETIYFKERMNNYAVLFWGNLLLNFVTPFLILMRNDTKRKFGTLFFVSAIVFFGHWWDYFYMIKPGVRTAAHEARMLAGGTHGHEAAPIDAHSEAAAPAKAGDHSAAAPAEQPVAHDAAAEKPAVDSAAHDHSAGEAAHSGAEPAAAAAPAAAQGDSHGQEGAHGDGHEAAAGHHGDSSFKLGYTIPGLDDLGVMIGFLSLFLYFFFSQLTRASLLPQRDPYLEESMHHSTGAYLEEEAGEQAHH